MVVNILTDKQLNWANGLLYDLDYYSLKKVFPDNISKFRDLFKMSCKSMSNKEFGLFIEGLKDSISVEYVLPCGLKVFISLIDCGGYYVLGDLEACMHECPKGGDINNCEYWVCKS